MKIPILYISHNINEVKALAQHVAIIDQGQLYRFDVTQKILEDDFLKGWI